MTIEVDKSQPCWIVTLNRPEKANALTRDMLVQLTAVMDDASVQGARALVLTGRGHVFSAGADLEEARAGLALDDIWERLSSRVAALPFLTVAALNGTLAGGAFGMAMACDLRIGVEGAEFFYPVLRLGFQPQPSDPARLAALVGPARARMVLIGGARLSDQEALSFGLIDRLVPRRGLEQAIRDVTRDAVNAIPAHVAAIKDLLR
ncbi:enoyl-CoA hydratase/carnithine racemase [Brevirhabdus pacifica]|uniref:enoyl-CoA hydratase/isomerase family protein n=1 Tax=Brevirhabdus pacifica TaxID=1267768 RepID=UPI000CB45FE1|nr:enoyl-CoA hydratase/isomerase family protein [Brevirhabdus pacifica]PJJ85559.1 enoyl-CoA hydratase/carnithine racemase [Brevirhabdus pacifica]